MCGKMVTSCGMTRTSHSALYLRAHAEHMNNTNAHTTIHNPCVISGVRSSTIISRNHYTRIIIYPKYSIIISSKNYDIDLHTHSLNGWKIHPVLLEILNNLTAKQAVDGCFFVQNITWFFLMICWARWFTILNLQISHVSSRNWIDRFTGKKGLDFFAGQETMIFMPHIFSVADW